MNKFTKYIFMIGRYRNIPVAQLRNFHLGGILTETEYQMLNHVPNKYVGSRRKPSQRKYKRRWQR